MKLSKNFSLKEMTASQTAERKGINNNPNDDQITALQKLCENILTKPLVNKLFYKHWHHH